MFIIAKEVVRYRFSIGVNKINPQITERILKKFSMLMGAIKSFSRIEIQKRWNEITKSVLKKSSLIDLVVDLVAPTDEAKWALFVVFSLVITVRLLFFNRLENIYEIEKNHAFVLIYII